MAEQSGRRVVEHHGRQEGRDGGDRHRAGRLRHRAHARQLEDLPRRRGHRRLCGVPPHDGRAAVSLQRAAVGRSYRPPRLRRAAHHRRRPAHPDELGRAPPGLRHQAFHRDDLRGSYHALERDHPRPLRRLSPAAPDGRRGRLPARRVPRAVRLPQRRGRLLDLVRVAVLHRGDGVPVPAPGSRSLELAPDSGMEQRADHTGAAGAVARGGAGRVPRLHLRPRCRPGRVDPLKEAQMAIALDARIPEGPIEQKWDRCRFEMKLVNPANRRKHTVLVVGSGLAGAAAAATLGEQGYHVQCFSFHDTPRRAHSIAAQGGMNAAKNYRNDGDSVFRLFYDTVKGGDFRAREDNAYRLAQVSVNIIDQCVAQGVPFARDYGGLLETRSFGGVQVERTFYARGQTGQQLLLGAYQALERQIAAGTVTMHPRSEMLDLVVIDGKARGIVTRDLQTGAIDSYVGDVVVLATGGYGNVFYLSTNAKGANTTAIWRAHRRGALFGNPCFTQIHPTCIPLSSEHQSKLTLMSESLRNDGRVWVPKKQGDTRAPKDIPESERDYYLENRYPSFGNLVPRDVASRNANEVCDEGRGVGPHGQGVYLDFADAIHRLGLETVREKYGNLFDIYQRITGEDAYTVPMRIYPAPHYTMGGLWVDYHLMTTIPGLFAAGEANFSDHGANRLGASALMQGLADGYFVVPATVPDYIASTKLDPVDTSHAAFREAEEDVHRRTHALLKGDGRRTVDSFHRDLGRAMWDECGMARSDAGLRRALEKIPELRQEFHENVRVLGTGEELNQSLEKAGRVADFLELAELMCVDALQRAESCGGHFRVESQTPEGEALRDDERFSYASAWEWKGDGGQWDLHKEPLAFEYVHLAQR